jgi:hypothetical protein
VITKESEAKFTEMKKNFDNLRSNYEKLYKELQDFKRKEVEVTKSSFGILQVKF